MYLLEYGLYIPLAIDLQTQSELPDQALHCSHAYPWLVVLLLELEHEPLDSEEISLLKAHYPLVQQVVQLLILVGKLITAGYLGYQAWMLVFKGEVKKQGSVGLEGLFEVFVIDSVGLNAQDKGSDEVLVQVEVLLLLVVIEVFVLGDFQLAYVNLAAHIVPVASLFKHGIGHSSYVAHLFYEVQVAQSRIGVQLG